MNFLSNNFHLFIDGGFFLSEFFSSFPNKNYIIFINIQILNGSVFGKQVMFLALQWITNLDFGGQCWEWLLKFQTDKKVLGNRILGIQNLVVLFAHKVKVSWFPWKNLWNFLGNLDPVLRISSETGRYFYESFFDANVLVTAILNQLKAHRTVDIW